MSLVNKTVTAAFEKHWTVKDLSANWGVSPQTIRKLFGGEPGVAFMGHGDTRKTRRYKTMLIPGTVVHRVHERMVRIPVRED